MQVDSTVLIALKMESLQLALDTRSMVPSEVCQQSQPRMLIKLATLSPGPQISEASMRACTGPPVVAGP